MQRLPVWGYQHLLLVNSQYNSVSVGHNGKPQTRPKTRKISDNGSQSFLEKVMTKHKKRHNETVRWLDIVSSEDIFRFTAKPELLEKDIPAEACELQNEEDFSHIGVSLFGLQDLWKDC